MNMNQPTRTVPVREPEDLASRIERVLVAGDLKELTPEQRTRYYRTLCDTLGLNWLAKPFEYIVLNGKLQLYATRNATDQLRFVHTISVSIVDRKLHDGLLIVHAKARMPSGREDEDLGVVPIGNAQGEAKSNLIMKCVTKAKRRVTLSICGLSFIDETEVDSIPAAKPAAAVTAELEKAIEAYQ